MMITEKWEVELNGKNHEVKIDIDSNSEDERLYYIYFDGKLIRQESSLHLEAKAVNWWNWYLTNEVTICSFTEYGFAFSIKVEKIPNNALQALTLYIDEKNADLVTSFRNNHSMPSRLNAHAWSKDVIVPIVVALLGGGGIFGLIKGCQELTRSTSLVNSQETTATAQKSNSACFLRPGAYKASVTRKLGLALREQPLKNDPEIQRIKLNQEIIVLKKNSDGNWLYVCLEGTDKRGWVIGEHTKKI
ncbi:SH3 domain-containing protein [Fortiea sp. LEGE XX443]|uniref:SH3 domain-containing protein n=1 Tax=Fortiea sp. LEGE XX443 TaxID=1828611 RepID=UPI001881F5E5|nr:SH3 domain-containing protein [Fortiea sp. LEGE XX443]MBE9008467.1 SH3 domain-containing protein [Fortiea sp. LEGE XX443]